MKQQQKIELETIVKSLTNTLDDVEEQDVRIDITGIRPEEVILIKDLLANYLKKHG